MKKLFNTIIFALVSSSTLLLLNYGCAKENNKSVNNQDSFYIKAVIDSANNIKSKTQHVFNEFYLKTTWKKDDRILIINNNNLSGILFEKIDEGDGSSAVFSKYNYDSADPIGDITAFYPSPKTEGTSEEKIFSLSLPLDWGSKPCKLSDLSKYDFLIAESTITEGNSTILNFTPICAIIRFPEGTTITNSSVNGNIKLSLSGDNVAYKIIKSRDGLTFSKGAVSYTVNVSKGKLTEDAYLSFIPKERTGRYIYYLKTNSGDQYELYKDGISPSKVYNLNTPVSGNVVFYDDAFKKYCLSNFDKNEDGEISYAEAKLADSINVAGKKTITSLFGIQHFSNVSIIRCSDNQITGLSVSGCTALQELDCSHNKITSLDISGCAALQKLNCTYNQLTSLDISSCTALQNLKCSDNKFSNLSVSGCTALQALDCSSNKITSLNISSCTALQKLDCAINNITSLNVSKNLALAYLYCDRNKLSSLDVSKNTLLRVLSAWEQLVKLSKVYIKRGQEIQYRYRTMTPIDPKKYGTTIVEVD